MIRHILISEQECDGCETCVKLCPEVFGFDQEAGLAGMIWSEAGDGCLDEAIDTCLSECVSL